MIICDTVEDWAGRICKSITNRLGTALKAGRRASLLVSGGSTPAPIYAKLGRQNLDWENIDIALVDERWVEPDHPASNARLIKNTLCQGPASLANFTGMKTQHASPQLGLEPLKVRDDALPYPFDVVLLGMGNDGHTASLFPQAHGLGKAMNCPNKVAAITAKKSDVTGTHTQRMTLSAPAIASAHCVILALKGAQKRATLKTAQSTGDIHDMPIRAFLGQDNLKIYWTAA